MVRSNYTTQNTPWAKDAISVRIPWGFTYFNIHLLYFPSSFILWLSYMASPTQRDYIKDLSVRKLKEFKELKELIASRGIMGTDTEGFTQSTTADEILDRLTDKQASELITALLEKSEPVRSRTYSTKRSKQVVDLLDKMKATINGWHPSELQ